MNAVTVGHQIILVGFLFLKQFDRVQITTWGHDPSILQTSNILLTLQDCLTHSAVLVQAYSKTTDTGTTEHVSFPIQKGLLSSNITENIHIHVPVG